MAKTPFKFKPTGQSPSGRMSEQKEDVKILGSSDILGLYSDVFLILNEAETGMANIYFYQRQIADSRATFGTTQPVGLYSTARCISRIVMSKEGIDKLLGALAENRGYTLTPKPKVGDE